MDTHRALLWHLGAETLNWFSKLTLGFSVGAIALLRVFAERWVSVSGRTLLFDEPHGVHMSPPSASLIRYLHRNKEGPPEKQPENLLRLFALVINCVVRVTNISEV